MAKKSSAKSKNGLSTSVSKSTKDTNYIKLPYINDRQTYNTFVTNTDYFAEIFTGLIFLVIGMNLIAQIASRVKGLKVTEIFKLSSVNTFIKRFIVSNPQTRLAIASIVAYHTLNAFDNADDINVWLLRCRDKAPVGKLIPNVAKMPIMWDTHRECSGLFP
jgi:hypothetical protein